MDFTPTTYKVYARADENGKVTKIFSTCFEEPNDIDILLKEGSGDEFVHVGYYQIFNEDFTHKYCIDNGEMRECTTDEIEVEKASFPTPPPTNTERIEQLEADAITQNEVSAELLYELSMMQLGI